MNESLPRPCLSRVDVRVPLDVRTGNVSRLIAFHIANGP
jgi:hypothetical protein